MVALFLYAARSQLHEGTLGEGTRQIPIDRAPAEPLPNAGQETGLLGSKETATQWREKEVRLGGGRGTEFIPCGAGPHQCAHCDAPGCRVSSAGTRPEATEQALSTFQ